jgi:hypothetical protein
LINFLCLPFGIEYNHLKIEQIVTPIEIARIFCGSLAAISEARVNIDGKYLGVGFIKDFDLINNEVLIIS